MCFAIGASGNFVADALATSAGTFADPPQLDVPDLIHYHDVAQKIQAKLVELYSLRGV